MSKKIVVSGIRPTGYLHLGNYFGAIQNFVKMQDDYECYVFVADYHSLTTHPEPSSLKSSVYRVVAENIAAGLDPDKVTLYTQSDIPEIPELYLILNTLAYKGELEKTTSFKEKARLQPQNINAALLTYPALMAADILIHKAELVPVGKDQEQHLEMTRNFAQRFNHRYGETFPEPHGFNFGDQLIKIPSLDGAGKMSKSENENATLYLADSDELIRKKVMKAKTDAGPQEPNTTPPEEVENLFTLMSLVTTPQTVQQYRDSYADCSIRYGDMKKQLAEDLVAYIKPIRSRAEKLLSDPQKIESILKKGAEKARKSTQKTLSDARSKIGLNYYE